MSETTVAAGWGEDRVPVVCNDCDWRYLTAVSTPVPHCPHCASGDIEALSPGDLGDAVGLVPELAVPYRVGPDVVGRQVAAFAEPIPFPPEDLAPDVLVSRMQRVLLPVWLVDTDAVSDWRAEVGFDYEVVSHRERYADGAGWSTHEVQEGRIRWEPRVGRLGRHYANVAAPGLTTHGVLTRLLGDFDLGAAVPLTGGVPEGVIVRLPDRSAQAAWADAQSELRRRAQDECRDASGADHVRDFRWSPVCSDLNWTLLLLPLYLTHYRDDEGAVQRVLVNGQTGRLHGASRGSARRAQRRALTIGIVALIAFALSLIVGLAGLIVPPLLVVGLLGGIVAVLIGAGALAPIGRVALFNRRQKQIPVET